MSSSFSLKRKILMAWTMTVHVRSWIKLSKFLADRIPVLGRVLSMILDRLLVVFYGVDVTSQNMFVADLRIPHPVGVLLGGNGMRSDGTVVINSGVKFVGRSPRNTTYLERHAQKRVLHATQSKPCLTIPKRPCATTMVWTICLTMLTCF